MIHICDLRAASGLKMMPSGTSAKKRTSAPSLTGTGFPHIPLIPHPHSPQGGRPEGAGGRGGGRGGGSIHFNAIARPARTLNKLLVSY